MKRCRTIAVRMTAKTVHGKENGKNQRFPLIIHHRLTNFDSFARGAPTWSDISRPYLLQLNRTPCSTHIQTPWEQTPFPILFIPNSIHLPSSNIRSHCSARSFAFTIIGETNFAFLTLSFSLLSVSPHPLWPLSIQHDRLLSIRKRPCCLLEETKCETRLRQICCFVSFCNSTQALYRPRLHTHLTHEAQTDRLKN